MLSKADEKNMEDEFANELQSSDEFVTTDQSIGFLIKEHEGLISRNRSKREERLAEIAEIRSDISKIDTKTEASLEYIRILQRVI